MKQPEVTVGMKLEMTLYNNFIEKRSPRLFSQFESEFENGQAVITAPFYRGILYAIHVNSEVEITYLIQDCVYSFKALVVEKYQNEQIAFLKIKQTSDITKIQRREFFRFKVALPFKYRIIPADKPPEEIKKIQFKSGYTRDISGGGMCFLSNDVIEEKSLVEFELLIEEKKTIRFYGIILRVSKNLIGDLSKYEVGVMINQIEQKNRESIIGWIFEKQRNLRRKGMI